MSAKQRPNKERALRSVARDVAYRIASLPALFDWLYAEEVTEGSKEEGERLEAVNESLFVLGIMLSRDNPAKFLRSVADALDGKLKDYRRVDYEETIKKIWNELSRNPGGGISLNSNFDFASFAKALRDRGGVTCSGYSLHRTLKRMGPPYSRLKPKRGRPRKNK